MGQRPTAVHPSEFQDVGDMAEVSALQTDAISVDMFRAVYHTTEDGLMPMFQNRLSVLTKYVLQ